MTAAWMWARSELRARWRAWLLLGLLAGATVGVAAAGWAGARRTERAVPALVAASRLPTAAVLPNDPRFDARMRAQVARLPGVTATYPFLLGISAEVFEPRALGNGGLFPVDAAAMRVIAGPLVDGRLPDPRRADEVVVDENARDRYGLHLGATMVVGQTLPTPGEVPPEYEPVDGPRAIRQTMTVVGIAKSVSGDASWTPSSGFYRKYHTHMPAVVNEFVDLRDRAKGIPAFAARVSAIAGHPVNVEDVLELYGIRKALDVTSLERDGLLLFAVAALVGGGVLVGQALVRAVSASASDLPTWRAMGADRNLAVGALVLPATVSAAVAAVTAPIVAIALSSRFPLGVAREFDLDLGTHADWLVLGVAVVALIAGIFVVAGASAWWRVTRPARETTRPSYVDRMVAPMSGAPALMIGARLAGEPGRGRRAVPVRSALIGAIAGVVGVVGCFTFRAGIEDAVHEPRRSGVVWSFAIASENQIPKSVVADVTRDRDVASALHAWWERAVTVNGQPVPVFGTRTLKGALPFVVLRGRAPVGPDEIAFAPTTMRERHLDLGERVTVGSGARQSARVVGEVLLPATSHTDYDQSGWMTAPGLARATGTVSRSGEDYLLVRWRRGTDVSAAQRRLTALAGKDLFTQPATLPVAVAELAHLEDLPFALGGFFALLACATVAHALVTTVRRRRHDLAVLRAVGFTRRQTRAAIAWQATLLAIAGIVVGVPLGIAAGRLAWRWLADDFPIVYVAPFALLAIAAVTTAAIVVANALAAGPAHVATRIRPAEALRVE